MTIIVLLTSIFISDLANEYIKNTEINLKPNYHYFINNFNYVEY